MWGEPDKRVAKLDKLLISTHSPRVGRTVDDIVDINNDINFNSLAPCGANLTAKAQKIAPMTFQLTRPVWGEPPYGTLLQYRSTYFNSLAPCGANPSPCSVSISIASISTHSPRVGRTRARSVADLCADISTHSPRVGRTHSTTVAKPKSWIFQLTRPVWGEPPLSPCFLFHLRFQLTRPVWGEPMPQSAPQPVQQISTHSPRVGRTLRRRDLDARTQDFNSLAPCGANPSRSLKRLTSGKISTHSPRVGRTAILDGLALYRDNFNSLAPCGANPKQKRIQLRASAFQLTRPVWGEPGRSAARPRRRSHFNSLAPCGANPPINARYFCGLSFQLTRPVWGEPYLRRPVRRADTISTHSPRVGRTRNRWNVNFNINISTHSPRVGRTPCAICYSCQSSAFQLTRPVWGEPCCVCLDRGRARDFNSLAPCGANPVTRRLSAFYGKFQLTRPVWGEPSALRPPLSSLKISTHSPRVGRTPCAICYSCQSSAFQLTRPVWGEPVGANQTVTVTTISTHSPRVGRTFLTFATPSAPMISTHSPRVGRTIAGI